MEYCQTNLNMLGTVNIKIRSLNNLYKSIECSESDARIFMERMRQIEYKYRELMKMKQVEKKNMERELSEANLTTNRLDEHYIYDKEENDEFFEQQNNKMNSILNKGIDSIQSLRRQDLYIDRISNRLKQGLIRLGVADDYIKDIESKSFGDKTLFIFLFILLILFIFLLRYLFG